MPVIQGPRGAIPYRRDAWGYPSLRARDEQEAAWAMGWVHGIDRHAQVAIAVMVGRGRLMELLGDVPTARTLDTCTRGLGLSRDAEAQVSLLGERARELGRAYCDGFNEAVGSSRRPFVMRALGLARHEHTLSDIVVMTRFLGWFGLNSLTQAAAQFIAQVCSDGLDERGLQVLLGDRARDVRASDAHGVRWPEVLRGMFGGAPGGSNAFAVAGARSGTGGALMMGEFHMQVGQLPPNLYALHIDLPDRRFVHGMTIPGLPTFASGRTDRVAWTYTFGHARNVEVWAERCRDGQHDRGGTWTPLRRRVEKVRVRGKAAPRWWVFHDSDRGTIWGDVRRESIRPGIRWRGMHEVHHDLDAMSELLAAQSVDDLVAIHRRVRCLALAATLADHTGRIAYCQTGVVGADPSRGVRNGAARSHDPDAGEDLRPVEVDPRIGVIASANEERGDWTAFGEPPYRHRRLMTLLTARDRLFADDLLRISYDEWDGMAARLLPVWEPHLPASEELRAVVAWGGTQGARQDERGRAHLATFHHLHHLAVLELLELLLGPAVATRIAGDPGTFLALQPRMDELLALEDRGVLDAERLAAVLARAWDRLSRVRADAPPKGRDPNPVVVARLLFKDFVLGGRLPPALGFSAWVDPLPGGPVCLFQSRGSPVANETIVTGPAFHLRMDMSTRLSHYNIAGPASERRFGPGSVQECVRAWAAGDLLPLGGVESPPHRS